MAGAAVAGVRVPGGRHGVPAHLQRLPPAGLLRAAHQHGGVALRLRGHCSAHRHVFLPAGESPYMHAVIALLDPETLERES